MRGSSNQIRLPLVDRKVDTRGDLLVGHEVADEECLGQEEEPYLSTGLGWRCLEACRSRSKH